MVPPRSAKAPQARERPAASEVAERRSRALEEPLEARLLTRLVYPLLEVRNPVHRTSYLVMLPEYPTVSSALCTCADFARRGLGTCKHIVAAERWLRANPDAPPSGKETGEHRRPSDVWRDIDRGLSELNGAKESDVRKLSRPGASLFEA